MGARCGLISGSLYDEDRECREERAAGCGASERSCRPKLTAARDREDRCWLFPDCLPATFTEVSSAGDPTCLEQVQRAPVCD